MSESPTDEQLAEWGDWARGWQEQDEGSGGLDEQTAGEWSAAFNVLIQEVRRLREVSTGYFEMNKKAEAEVERLREWKADHECTIAAGLKRLNEAMAERDRYRKALRWISDWPHPSPEPMDPRVVACDALKQQEPA